jgi:hypothetical protein
LPAAAIIARMALTPLAIACFKRNSTLTVDAVINGLDGEPANLAGLTGDDIQWALSASLGGERLVEVDLDGASTGTGDITITDAANGEIRIQFRPPLPPADPDPFKPRNRPYWHECFVNLSEAPTTQFFGPVRIEKSMWSAEE